MTERAQYSREEVAALTGATVHQLRYLEERGLVVPRGAGQKRIRGRRARSVSYDTEQLRQVAVFACLTKAGITLNQARLAEVLRCSYGVADGLLLISPAGAAIVSKDRRPTASPWAIVIDMGDIDDKIKASQES